MSESWNMLLVELLNNISQTNFIIYLRISIIPFSFTYLFDTFTLQNVYGHAIIFDVRVRTLLLSLLGYINIKSNFAFLDPTNPKS
ncbi:hypothetical protein FHS68_001002 [Dyadobacter arcticus]|uniref:Uncharacterized protein n=1 Tax=Dyadobacter arcticus TaxID=1078754 RepID=A0ABX0UL55_9BACT|nr:hypothetical protein [Dyadobacter arcticus]